MHRPENRAIQVLAPYRRTMLGLSAAIVLGAPGPAHAEEGTPNDVTATPTATTPPTGVIEARPETPNGGSRIISLRPQKSSTGLMWIPFEGARQIKTLDRYLSHIPSWASIQVVSSQTSDTAADKRVWKSAVRWARSLHKELGLKTPVAVTPPGSNRVSEVRILIRW